MTGAKTTQETSEILIRKTRVPVTTRELDQKSLKFFADNPRVYSIVRVNGKSPSQPEIEEKLQELEHVKVLVQDIKLNGGLIDPIIVKGGSLEVLEGNSRLAAYRILAKNDPIKWGKIKCTVLPDDIADSLVFSLLGQYHIKGKKDWAPYEQAGFLYRRFKVHSIDTETLATEIGLKKQRVEHLIETYDFMVQHEEADIDRWSYYDEYLKSSKIKKARKKYSNFDDVVVGKIVSGEIERAVDVRDKLKVICAAPDKILKKFVGGQFKFEQAYERAEEAGGTSIPYKKLAKFRQWLALPEVEASISQTQGEIRDKVEYELKHLFKRVEALKKKVGG